MENIKFLNIAIFAVFLGIAMIEAFEKHNQLESILFTILAILSLRADFQKK